MKTLLKHCPSKKGEPVALTSIQAKSGTATITDADFWLSFPLDKPDGFYPITEARADIWKPAQDLKFPIIKIPNKQPIEVPVSISDLTWISSAMSNEKTRYCLKGVHFDNAGMAATDGHILKHVAQPFAQVAQEEKLSAILPDFAVKIILDAAKEEKVTGITVQFIGSVAIVAVGRYLLRTKLIDGTFPDYTRVIPKDTGLATAFNSEEFKPLLKKAKVLDPEFQTVIVAQSHCYINKALDELVKLSGNWETPLAFNCGLLVSTDMTGIASYAEGGNPVKITNRNRVCVVMSKRQNRS